MQIFRGELLFLLVGRVSHQHPQGHLKSVPPPKKKRKFREILSFFELIPNWIRIIQLGVNSKKLNISQLTSPSHLNCCYLPDMHPYRSMSGRDSSKVDQGQKRGRHRWRARKCEKSIFDNYQQPIHITYTSIFMSLFELFPNWIRIIQLGINSKKLKNKL